MSLQVLVDRFISKACPSCVGEVGGENGLAKPLGLLSDELTPMTYAVSHFPVLAGVLVSRLTSSIIAGQQCLIL
jgi:hypothetical protein